MTQARWRLLSSLSSLLPVSSSCALAVLLVLLAQLSVVSSSPPLWLSFQSVFINPLNLSSPYVPSPRCSFLLTLPPPTSSDPSALSSLTSTLYLFGGLLAGSSGNDVWSTAVAANDLWWTTLPSPSTIYTPAVVWTPGNRTPVSPRYGLAGASTLVSVSSGGKGGGSSQKAVLLVAGGAGSNSLYYDDIWQFDTSPPSGAVAWTTIRQQSSLRDNSFGAQPVQLVQPSARAFTDWSTFVIDAELLLTLNQSALATPNLAAYLYANPGDISGPLLTYAMLGGRSNPSNPFSTTWTSSATPNSSLTSTSSLNADYADFWLWLQQANVWIRVGNVTCLQTSFSCADWVFPEQLLQQAGGGVDLLTSLSNISELAVAAVQPDQLIDTTGDMGSIASYIAAALQSAVSFLSSTTDPTYTTNDPSPTACALRCSDLQEIPAPTISPPLACPFSGGGGQGSGGVVCPFYNNVGQQTTLLGIGLSQYRPNASEGSASGSYVILNGNGGSLRFQFGGFSCAGQRPGVDPLSVTGWSSSCFSNTIFVQDATTAALAWWAITPPAASSLSSQLLLWPSPRAYSAMAVDGVNNLLWIYGGAVVSGGGWQFLNDLYVFDFINLQFLTMTLVGNSPPPMHSAALFFAPLSASLNQLFLFGGCGAGVFYNTLYAVQLNLQVPAANFIILGSGASSTTAGQVAVFYLWAVTKPDNNSTTTLPFARGLQQLFRFSWTVLTLTGTVVDLAPSQPQVYDIGNGIYLVNYTADTGRTGILTVQFRQRDGSFQSLPSSPLSITIAPAAFSPRATTLLYGNWTAVAQGQLSTVYLQMSDSFNNPEVASVGSLSVQLSYSAAGSASLTTLILSTTDNGDGTYSVTYSAPELESFLLFVKVANVDIVGSPFFVSGLPALVFPDSIQIAFLLLGLLLGALVLGLLVGVIAHRDNRVVRAGSPVFLCLICVGELLCIGSVVVLAYPSSTSCRLFPFLLTTGYILALSALFSKSYRVLVLFSPSSALSRVVLTDSRMLLPVFVLVCLESCLNLAWLISSPLSLQSESVSAVLSYHACTGSHATAFIAASTAFNSAVCMAGVALAVKIRQVPEAFNESKLMAAALYNIALMLLIAVPLTWTAQDTYNTHEDFLIPAACILWACLVTILTCVAPKLYYVLRPPPASFFDDYPQDGVMVKGVKGRNSLPAERKARQAGNVDAGGERQRQDGGEQEGVGAGDQQKQQPQALSDQKDCDAAIEMPALVSSFSDRTRFQQILGVEHARVGGGEEEDIEMMREEEETGEEAGGEQAAPSGFDPGRRNSHSYSMRDRLRPAPIRTAPPRVLSPGRHQQQQQQPQPQPQLQLQPQPQQHSSNDSGGSHGKRGGSTGSTQDRGGSSKQARESRGSRSLNAPAAALSPHAQHSPHLRQQQPAAAAATSARPSPTSGSTPASAPSSSPSPASSSRHRHEPQRLHTSISLEELRSALVNSAAEGAGGGEAGNAAAGGSGPGYSLRGGSPRLMSTAER